MFAEDRVRGLPPPVHAKFGHAVQAASSGIWTLGSFAECREEHVGPHVKVVTDLQYGEPKLRL